jgi:hypothetical protein
MSEMIRYIDSEGKLVMRSEASCLSCVGPQYRNYRCPLVALSDGEADVDTTGCRYAEDFGAVAPTIPSSQEMFVAGLSSEDREIMMRHGRVTLDTSAEA